MEAMGFGACLIRSGRTLNSWLKSQSTFKQALREGEASFVENRRWNELVKGFGFGLILGALLSPRVVMATPSAIDECKKKLDQVKKDADDAVKAAKDKSTSYSDGQAQLLRTSFSGQAMPGQADGLDDALGNQAGLFQTASNKEDDLKNRCEHECDNDTNPMDTPKIQALVKDCKDYVDGKKKEADATAKKALDDKAATQQGTQKNSQASSGDPSGSNNNNNSGKSSDSSQSQQPASSGAPATPASPVPIPIPKSKRQQ